MRRALFVLMLLCVSTSALADSIASPITLANVYSYQETATVGGFFWSQTKDTYASMPQIPVALLTDGNPATGQFMQPWQNVFGNGGGGDQPAIFFYVFDVGQPAPGSNIQFEWSGSIASNSSATAFIDFAIWSNGHMSNLLTFSGSTGSIDTSFILDPSQFGQDIFQNGEFWIAARVRTPPLPSGNYAPATIFDSEASLSITNNAATIGLLVPEPSTFLLLIGPILLIMLCGRLRREATDRGR